MDRGLRPRRLLRQPRAHDRRVARKRAAACTRDGDQRGRNHAVRASAELQRRRVRGRALRARDGRAYRGDPARSGIVRRRDRSDANRRSDLKVSTGTSVAWAAAALASSAVLAQGLQKDLDTPYVPTPQVVVDRMLDM